MSGEELCRAAWDGDLKRVKKILSGGNVDVNEKDKYGNTALIRASKWGHIEVVKYLLENGANVNEKKPVCKYSTDIS